MRCIVNNSKTITQIETIEIIQKDDTIMKSLWKPVEGDTIRTLGEKISTNQVDKQEWEAIKDEAISVLSNCVSPKVPSGQETGLVIGYVQSGKTLSYTTVAALAQDNNYPLVIVITGTSLSLTAQSTERLEEHLGLRTSSTRKWYHLKSHDFLKTHEFEVAPSKITSVLADWEDESVVESDRQTVLITVMKHHKHLEKLVDILSKIGNLNMPTLIIDDEGDQASLNTMIKKDEASTTYQRILSLRECFPHHTFLQYTATPQALLLINLIDVLSPNFVKVLSPGLSYTGGKAFFQNGQNQISTIPDSEIPTKDQPLSTAPDSLLEAMRIFFLGVAAGMILDDGREKRHRSMMVHPSHKTIGHEKYFKWISRIRNNWSKVLKLDEDEKDYQDLLEDFRNSYQSLHISVPDLPSFEELLKHLPRVIRRTEPHKVNATSGQTPSIIWDNAYSHLLVGGQAMDRGFTVRGLTVTYMPRGLGLGYADTVQQRARFFGYKKEIFGYCRVFLEDRVRKAFEHYVTHEEDIRQRLIEHAKTGKSLDDWRRTFLLDISFKPTRSNILDINYRQWNLGDQWYVPKAPHYPIDIVEANRLTVEKFCKDLSFQDDEGDPNRTEAQIHHVATDVLLQNVYKELIVPFRVKHFADSDLLTKVCLQIKEYLESYPNALCTVYRIAKDFPRKRSLNKKNEKNEIVRFFQGRNPTSGPAIYPGDREIKTPNCVTVQIHKLTILDEGKEISQNVPVLAIWLPKEITLDLLEQPQGGIETEISNDKPD